MRLIIGDTETTGLGPLRKAVDLALMEIDEDMNIVGTAEALLNPQRLIDPSATEIHGISDDDVKDCPTQHEWMMETFGGQIEEETCLIGYRISFDLPMIQPLFAQKLRIFDALPLVQTMFPDLANHKLQTIREHLALEGGTAHRAMGDVLTTHQLLQVIIPMTGRTLTDHVSTPFQMIHRMPWGKKHKGDLLVNLPRGYRKWLLDLSDLDPNLRRSLELINATDYKL